MADSEWYLMRVDPHEGYLEWPQHEVPISPAQAALGAMTEGEVAMALVARDDRRGSTPLALLADDQAWIQEAISRGLWPQEVGEDG